MATRKRKPAATKRKTTKRKTASRARRAGGGRLRRVGLALKILAIAAGAALIYEAGRFPDVAALAEVEPQITSFMEYRRNEAARAGSRYEVRYDWRPIETISPHLPRAVLVAEDDRFYQHDGFDFVEIRDAIEDSVREGKRLRGASTLTQQLARNLWLTPDRSWLRKGREAAYTIALDRSLDKDRILELYLNVAEWGPGLFGAEAAARYHFGVSAAELSAEQAALLAAALPNPLERDPGRADRAHRRRARRILARMGLRPSASTPARQRTRGRSTPAPPRASKAKVKKKAAPPATLRPTKTPTPRDLIRPTPSSPTPAPGDLLRAPRGR